MSDELIQNFAYAFRCPKCEAEVLAGNPDHPSDFSPPTCGMGHPPTEMEQINAATASERRTDAS